MGEYFQPPDPICKFCEDNCHGCCEGALEARDEEHLTELRNACDGVAVWLKYALGCKHWHWDPDQRDAAQECWERARDALIKTG